MSANGRLGWPRFGPDAPSELVTSATNSGTVAAMGARYIEYAYPFRPPHRTGVHPAADGPRTSTRAPAANEVMIVAAVLGDTRQRNEPPFVFTTRA